MTETQLLQRITNNCIAVRQRVKNACARVSRAPHTVRLVAVSKTFPLTHVQAAHAAGLTDLGENRVQEALEKISQLRDQQNITWHLIGHLQSNKAVKVINSIAWIHSVDSVELLNRLERLASIHNCQPNVLVQVNLANEVSKNGASVETCRKILEASLNCQQVIVKGLMTIPPWSKEPEHARRYFRDLRLFRDELVAAGIPSSLLHELSMGMSNDFEVAIEEGSTIVRVGTAIFGTRTAL